MAGGWWWWWGWTGDEVVMEGVNPFLHHYLVSATALTLISLRAARPARIRLIPPSPPAPLAPLHLLSLLFPQHISLSSSSSSSRWKLTEIPNLSPFLPPPTPQYQQLCSTKMCLMLVNTARARTPPCAWLLQARLL